MSMRRMKPSLWGVILAVGAAAAPAVRAQWEELEALPGYFPLEELAIVDAEALTIEINLTAPMLRMVAAFAGEAEPELAALVEGLQAVRVRSGELGEGEAAGVRSRFQTAGRWLDERGWTPMVKVRDGNEEVLIYSRLDEAGAVEGMTILALEGSEITVVNLIGRLDPEQLGRIASGLDLPFGAADDFEDAEDGEDDGEQP